MKFCFGTCSDRYKKVKVTPTYDTTELKMDNERVEDLKVIVL